MIPLHTFSNFLLLFERNSGIGCIDSIRSLSVALNYIFITAKIIWLSNEYRKNEITNSDYLSLYQFPASTQHQERTHLQFRTDIHSPKLLANSPPKYILHKLSMRQRCAFWGNHNKPFRNNAHGTFHTHHKRRLKEYFSVAASVAGDEQERAFAGPTYAWT